MTNELKAKLLAAKSAEEVTELIKADGKEITAEDAAHLWEEISRKREQNGKELSLDELDAVSGGADRDWATDGCAATVEPNSWCGSNDRCFWTDVTYDNEPVDVYCTHCGTPLYTDAYFIGDIYTCKVCQIDYKRNKGWVMIEIGKHKDS